MRDFNAYWRQQRDGARTDLWSGSGRAFRVWMRVGQGGSAGKNSAWPLAMMGCASVIVCAFAGPLMWTGTSDTCTAFETALLRRSWYDVPGTKRQAEWYAPTAEKARKSASQGLVGRHIAGLEHPWLPSPISCTVLFWQVRIGA
jgi:hypothetical protein